MKFSEVSQIIAAIIIFAIVVSFEKILEGDILFIFQGIIFSALIISVAIFAKKVVAGWLDIDVEHRLWMINRYGFRPQDHFDREIPAGIILPLFFSLFTLGWSKIGTILVYEATAMKRRAARRFGYFSYAELSEWHNGLIGAAGIASVLILSLVAYFLPYNLENLARFATYYAFFNLLPISKFDGTQILFASRVLWATLGIITVIFTIYALIL